MVKKSNKSTTEVLRCVTNGIVKLIEGQKCFANEFGLSFSRIFPNMELELPTEDLVLLIEKWISGEEERAEENLQQLFIALIKHQLALMAALDGVALNTLQALSAKPSEKSLLNLPLSKSSKTTLQEYQNNYRLRYKKLIAPGFIESYMKIRQELINQE